MPKLSIISINLNNTKGLKKTMQSVIKQILTDFEYLIINGGDTDGGKKYVQKNFIFCKIISKLKHFHIFV